MDKQPKIKKPSRDGFRDKFHVFSKVIANATGSVWAFMTALLVVVGWGISGPLFGFSDTWQLVINTSTTIVTFLMVFMIQSTQNRDSKALQLKLDELLRAAGRARNELIDLENLSEAELDHLASEFARVHRQAEKGETTEEDEDTAKRPKAKSGK